ncbi:threonine--tRNA ligase [Candidatus Shapirobacteria bacterium CG_4_10_14_3_um_filter_35_13]|uniref:Threonine--tRNA ligase n=1 Tax=Candidatus Shapirobacteria bacterium CG_4_10_14_3_um_filter_35_13 TaxID=1974873 RepID=A0A2M7LJA2_9BACT|nr:MAG: threonine--tRNA ligase [Candidatus Shapirobacteria bacterium CG_4_10_14_3_um_filter_35_13]
MSQNDASQHNDDNLYKIRHSAEHILSQAVENLYPDKTIRVMGPATDDGFYMDVETIGDFKLSDSNFPEIEAEMQKIIKSNLPIIRKKITMEEACDLFTNNPYKIEWLDSIKDRGEIITIYSTGNQYTDLCAGPHVNYTSKIKAFKLLSIAGAYWHGDEKNKMLTRIYGTAFENKDDLETHLNNLEEIKKRDHRKLGKELDLYSTNQLTGAGLILWHPKLATSRNVLETFWREEHIRRGYQLVFTPHIAGMDMFVKTRHYTKYINSMFPVMLHQNIEGESKNDYTTDEQLKPMNCPNHVQVFKSSPRSYRELPFRMGELGTVYRYEKAGVLHGMTRVRGFTQDDSHIFCTPEQAINEVQEIIKLTKYIYEDIFGFQKFQAYLSTRPEKYLGSVDMWEFAQNSLIKAMESEKLKYKVDEGGGAFYGPKIDFKIKDSIGREWQMGTIQFDFNLPTYSESSEKDVDDFWKLKTFKDKYKTKKNLAKYIKQMGRGLDAKFVDKDGKEKPVVMIHRVVLGSLERFFGVIIEHFAGAFPTWLSPVQVKLIPITDAQHEFANKVLADLKAGGIRVEIDDRPEKMQAKIRDAQMQKIPYMLIIGAREVKANTVAVRQRDGQDLGAIPISEFITKIKEQVTKKSLNLIK